MFCPDFVLSIGLILAYAAVGGAAFAAYEAEPVPESRIGIGIRLKPRLAINAGLMQKLIADETTLSLMKMLILFFFY